ncbi:MAG: methyltransferase domain-containing protein [Gemmatimonadota bacterium]|nr:methyltransferase domain-containing protein [Gemmatimonadota bacterium]
MATSEPDPPRIFTPEYYERMRSLEADSWWNSAMRDIAGGLLRDARLPASGLLLDAGCGSGQTMTWFERQWPLWTTIGFDVAAHGLLSARQHGHTVARASATELPHPARCADLIITLDVLQHLPLKAGDDTALREMQRVLKPGGLLLIRTNAQSFPASADDAKFDFRKYTPSLLGARLTAAGFDILRLGRVNALLGLAEIPREIRAGRQQETDYHGILATPRSATGFGGRIKRAWLGLEGRAMRQGWQLPLGRTIFALCRREAEKR